MKHISLFSGIGGFDLAANWAGWTNIASCEINPFGRRILSHYWPEAYHHDDIKTLTGKIIEHEVQKRYGQDWRADGVVLSGGFPCQPYSHAGKRLGKNDDRHLWPEMLRIIQEVKPNWVVGENVRGLVNWSNGLVFQEVQSDLEAEGYQVQSFILPACATNAPHRRDRIWIIAYRTNQKQLKQTIKRIRPKFRYAFNANGKDWFITNASNIRQKQPCSTRKRRSKLTGCDINAGRITTNTNSKRYEKCDTSSESSWQKQQHCEKDTQFRLADWQYFPTQSPVCTRDDGLPSKLDGITVPKWRNQSIAGAGNAVVPQLVLKIFEAINEYESLLL